MADTFTLAGSFETKPASGSPSADPTLISPINEVVSLTNKLAGRVDLSADALTPLDMGDLANAAVVILKTVGGKVKAELTSADGTSQIVPVDSFLALIGLAVPITAISLQRVPGQTTSVKFFLGERV